MAAALLASACSRSKVDAPRHVPQATAATETTKGGADEPATPKPQPPLASQEPALGVTDRGVFGDLDARVQLPPPRSVATLLLDEARGLLTAYSGGHPSKVYPVGKGKQLSVAGTTLSVRPGDHAELAAVAASAKLKRLAPGQAPPPGDADGDGIADPLDLRIGAAKAALNGASYSDAYFSMPFPGGDAPRNRGACVDVVVRASRNAGLDLQAEVQRDIASAKKFYGVTRRDTSIDHRRVRVVIRYFERHWPARSTALDDPADPLLPGDVVFLDTFPNRPGPDHVGVVSETRGKSGHPLIINNWTTGYTTRAMDLLSFVPVTHRFRFPSSSPK